MSDEIDHGQHNIIRSIEGMRAATRQRLIDLLGTVMDEIKAGNVSAFAVATVRPDLSTGSAFMIGDKTLVELLGSVRLMEHRLITTGEERALD